MNSHFFVLSRCVLVWNALVVLVMIIILGNKLAKESLAKVISRLLLDCQARRIQQTKEFSVRHHLAMKPVNKPVTLHGSIPNAGAATSAMWAADDEHDDIVRVKLPQRKKNDGKDHPNTKLRVSPKSTPATKEKPPTPKTDAEKAATPDVAFPAGPMGGDTASPTNEKPSTSKSEDSFTDHEPEKRAAEVAVAKSKVEEEATEVLPVRQTMEYRQLLQRYWSNAAVSAVPVNLPSAIKSGIEAGATGLSSPLMALATTGTRCCVRKTFLGHGGACSSYLLWLGTGWVLLWVFFGGDFRGLLVHGFTLVFLEYFLS